MAPYFVYVTLSGEDKVAVYAMDRDSGRLVLVDVVAVPGVPAPLALHPNRRFLFAARRSDLEISAFKVDGASGRLAHIGAVPLESDPCYLATDRRGGYLFSAYYTGGGIGVHRIRGDGSLDSEPVEWRSTAPGAHSMQADPSNQFVFVPHIATLSSEDEGLNAILQFRFDQQTGRLMPGSPAQVSPDRRLGPRHFCFHPTLDMLYFSDEQGNSVTSYSLDPRPRDARPRTDRVHLAGGDHSLQHVRPDTDIPYGQDAVRAEPGPRHHRMLLGGRRGPPGAGRKRADGADTASLQPGPCGEVPAGRRTGLGETRRVQDRRGRGRS